MIPRHIKKYYQLLTDWINRLAAKALPERFGRQHHYHQRAKMMVLILLFSGIIGLLLFFITTFFIPEDNPVEILPAALLCFALVWFFKRTGKMALVGNFLAALWFFPLAMEVPSTGGLHSDNLIWISIAPLVALLFANKLSGHFWISMLLAFTLYLYVNNITITSPDLPFGGSFYYFISYFLYFFSLYCVVIIFEGGQLTIISELEKQKTMLQDQKKQLESQRDLMNLQNIEIEKKNVILEKLKETLSESNRELESFAYAASHDLKEPLRMISMYTQVIQKRLGEQLLDSEKESMFFITDGVKRMQNLLDDLLRYSRLGKSGKEIKEVNLDNLIFLVEHNLSVVIQESGAVIQSMPLPVIQGVQVEMSQLFQNLVSNAIKFRKPEKPPHIQIAVKEYDAHTWLFSIQDNGIGIPAEFREKVFGIFERLHNHSQYEGTGIGLATCRKIVENAGGKIWLESIYGEGTTFFFTLPKIQSLENNYTPSPGGKVKAGR